MNAESAFAVVLAVLLALLGWLGVESIDAAEEALDRLNSHCAWHVGKGEIDACKH